MIHNIDPRLLTRAVKVVLVGAGGTGSHVLRRLANMHLAMVELGQTCETRYSKHCVLQPDRRSQCQPFKTSAFVIALVFFDKLRFNPQTLHLFQSKPVTCTRKIPGAGCKCCLQTLLCKCNIQTIGCKLDLQFMLCIYAKS